MEVRNMRCIAVQMIDSRISFEWWRAIIKIFVKENAELQIRCWNEELYEIKQACKYGKSHIEGYETCIEGVVSADFLNMLLHADEPNDKTVYNKMTKYFTIRVSDGENIFESAHYGTELYIVTSPENVKQFNKIMKPYMDSFSISVTKV